MPVVKIELAEFVERAVASGSYASADEVVRDGLDMLRDEEEPLELRRAIQLGIEDAEAGRLHEVSVAEIADRLREKRRQRGG
jgi:antitoxin ParD1/3/4